MTKQESPLEKLVQATGDYIKAFDLIRGKDVKEMTSYVKFTKGPSLTYYYRNLKEYVRT